MKTLKIAGVWILFVVLPLSLLIKFYVMPRRQADEHRQREEQSKRLVEATSAAVQIRDVVKVAIDGFSGYWVLRSPEFAKHLESLGCRIDFEDDGGNYPLRHQKLRNGDVDAAVFTVDAYLVTSAQFQAENPDAPIDTRLPGSFTLMIDETKGADALVGYKSVFPNIDSMNRPDVKFILTPSSPSETLARVVFGYFNLNRVDRTKCFVGTQSSAEVYDIARKADPKAPNVYGVWQPELSKILQNPNIGVIVDSSRFRGYIADGFMFTRKFLAEHGELAKGIEIAYLRTQYNQRNGLVAAVKSDALAAQGISLSDRQANDTVNGIWWKNTSENYAQMGLEESSLQQIDDVIRQNVDILVKSGAIRSDPTERNPGYLYYPGILKELKDSGFHPGISGEKEDMRREKELPPLTADQWAKLQKIGTMQVDELVFSRGSSELTDSSRENLDRLAESLRAWPTYYVTIEGSSAGDPEMALERARSAESYLVEKGVAQARVRATQSKTMGKTRVSFVLGQQPF